MRNDQMNTLNKIAVLFFCLSASITAFTQPQSVDKVVAVVGVNPILQSDIEKKRGQAKLDSIPFNPCSALEDLLYQKLLLVQAVKDSVEVTDEQVEDELDRRLRHFIYQFGSVKAFESYIGKSVDKFKEESKDELKEVLLVQKMQAKITEGISVSPSEIKAFYDAIPKDSIPFINAEVEVGHIVKVPAVNPELKKYAKEKLESIRQDIISGKKDFSTSAISYSMDPGSAMNGGLYKEIQRGSFVPEFDAVAFRIKEKEVSEVFETTFGYHILMVEERRGEEMDVRHILITPEAADVDLFKAKSFLDSIANLVQKDSISLSEAASRFSEDEETKNNGGLFMNSLTGTTLFEMSQVSQIDPNIVFVIDNLKTGELSAPALTQYQTKKSYEIIFVKSRTEPHRANLKDDYQRIQQEALAEKKEKNTNSWITKKAATTYIHIDDQYKKCKFDNVWIRAEKQF